VRCARLVCAVCAASRATEALLCGRSRAICIARFGSLVPLIAVIRTSAGLMAIEGDPYQMIPKGFTRKYVRPPARRAMQPVRASLTGLHQGAAQQRVCLRGCMHVRARSACSHAWGPLSGGDCLHTPCLRWHTTGVDRAVTGNTIEGDYHVGVAHYVQDGERPLTSRVARMAPGWRSATQRHLWMRTRCTAGRAALPCARRSPGVLPA
jgi:hypothetical protein